LRVRNVYASLFADVFVRLLFVVVVDGHAGEKQYKFEEILPIYKQVSADAESGTFADFMEAFKTFDREGQGFINAAELRHVLTSLGLNSTFSTVQYTPPT